MDTPTSSCLYILRGAESLLSPSHSRLSLTSFVMEKKTHRLLNISHLVTLIPSPARLVLNLNVRLFYWHASGVSLWHNAGSPRARFYGGEATAVHKQRWWNLGDIKFFTLALRVGGLVKAAWVDSSRAEVVRTDTERQLKPAMSLDRVYTQYRPVSLWKMTLSKPLYICSREKQKDQELGVGSGEAKTKQFFADERNQNTRKPFR